MVCAAAATEPDQMEISLIGKSVTPLFDHPSFGASVLVRQGFVNCVAEGSAQDSEADIAQDRRERGIELAARQNRGEREQIQFCRSATATVNCRHIYRPNTPLSRPYRGTRSRGNFMYAQIQRLCAECERSDFSSAKALTR